MQPTYLPWLGYMDLMDEVDQFVYLDTVQFARRSWQQRNHIKGPAGLQWLTVPVASKGQRSQTIAETQITADFAGDHLRTIQHCYARAPHAANIQADLAPRLEAFGPGDPISELTVSMIEWMARSLGITTPSTRASALGVDGRRSARLDHDSAGFGGRRVPQSAGLPGLPSRGSGRLRRSRDLGVHPSV